MSDMRPTPETDAMFTAFNHHLSHAIDPADFTRKLERERDEVRKCCDKQAEMLACQAKRNAELQKQLEATKAYAERCKQGCINLSFAIDRIDYVCGEPNEMEVSDYALHQDEKHVVERVKKQLEAMREAIKDIYFLTEGYADGAPDASAHDKLCNEIADKLQPFLKTKGIIP